MSAVVSFRSLRPNGLSSNRFWGEGDPTSRGRRSEAKRRLMRSSMATDGSALAMGRRCALRRYSILDHGEDLQIAHEHLLAVMDFY